MPDDAPRLTPEEGRPWSRTEPDIRTARLRRRELLVGHEDMVAVVEQVLFWGDPVGINFETNTDEYRPEAETITLRLVTEGASSKSILHEMIIDEFAHWFGAFAVRDPARYDHIADELWIVWCGIGN